MLVLTSLILALRAIPLRFGGNSRPVEYAGRTNGSEWIPAQSSFDSSFEAAGLYDIQSQGLALHPQQGGTGVGLSGGSIADGIAGRQVQQGHVAGHSKGRHERGGGKGQASQRGGQDRRDGPDSSWTKVDFRRSVETFYNWQLR